MAAPLKDGLSYFSLDVDIFTSEKLFDLQNEYGPIGEVIYFRLLCMIYRKGYYLEFESIDKLASILIKSIGNRWIRDKKVVIQVIPFLAKCNLFSPELMQENVLTSVGVQERYFKATERRKPKYGKYILIDRDIDAVISVPKNKVKAINNKVNVCNNSKNVSNNEQSKVKESSNNTIITYMEIVNLYHEVCLDLPKVVKLTPKRIAAIKKLIKEMDENFTINSIKNGFVAINTSAFCKGAGDTGWKATFDFCIKSDSIVKALEGKYSNNGDGGRFNERSNNFRKCNFGNSQEPESGYVPNSGFRR